MNAIDQVFFAEEPTTDGPTRLGRMIGNVLGLAIYPTLMCGSWDLTNRTVSDGVTSGVAGVPMSRCIRHGSPELGLDGRSSPAAAQRCAYSAGLDGPDKPRATLKPG